MYNCDWSVLKELKNIDRDLDCKYNQEIGRFVVTFKRATGGEPVPVLWIETENNEFRFPDYRDVQKIAEMDSNKDAVRDRLSKSSYAIDEFAKKQRARASEEILAMTREDRRILMKAFNKAFFGGKADPFCKVTPKPKGKSFGK